jgi:hypothetical protein
MQVSRTGVDELLRHQCWLDHARLMCMLRDDTNNVKWRDTRKHTIRSFNRGPCCGLRIAVANCIVVWAGIIIVCTNKLWPLSGIAKEGLLCFFTAHAKHNIGQTEGVLNTDSSRVKTKDLKSGGIQQSAEMHEDRCRESVLATMEHWHVWDVGGVDFSTGGNSTMQQTVQTSKDKRSDN